MNIYIHSFRVKKNWCKEIVCPKSLWSEKFWFQNPCGQKKFWSKKIPILILIFIYEYHTNTYTDFPKNRNIPMWVVPMIILSIPRCMIIFPLLYLYLIQQDCLGVMLAKQTPHP